jgi:hypothetical protein
MSRMACFCYLMKTLSRPPLTYCVNDVCLFNSTVCTLERIIWSARPSHKLSWLLCTMHFSWNYLGYCAPCTSHEIILVIVHLAFLINYLGYCAPCTSHEIILVIVHHALLMKLSWLLFTLHFSWNYLGYCSLCTSHEMILVIVHYVLLMKLSWLLFTLHFSPMVLREFNRKLVGWCQNNVRSACSTYRRGKHYPNQLFSFVCLFFFLSVCLSIA